MNEFLFFIHIAVVLGFILLAYRMGKGALSCLVVFQAMLANVFVMKQILLFGWTVTCSDVFAIGGILSLNLLQESWGREAASKTINSSFLCLVFFAAMTQIHLIYEPSVFDETQKSFEVIFSSSLRIVVSSIAVYYIVQKLDVRFFSFLKKIFSGKFLPVRLFSSLLFSQLIDTILFSILGLYGLVESLLDIIIMSYLIKCVIIASSSTFVATAKRWILSARVDTENDSRIGY